MCKAFDALFLLLYTRALVIDWCRAETCGQMQLKGLIPEASMPLICISEYEKPSHWILIDDLFVELRRVKSSI